MMTNILEYLEKTVSWLPQKRAFWDAGEEVTFSQLYKDARAVGYYLYRRGIRREPVAVFMGRRPSAVAAMLGTVYAGCYFVPLDTEMTACRIGTILKKVRPRVILCDEKSYPVLENTPFAGCRQAFDKASAEPAPEAALAAIRSRQVDTDPVCVLFPAGAFRGVLTSHRAALDAAESLGDLLKCSSNTVFGSHALFSSDAWLREMLCTLKYGAGTCLLPKRGFLYPARLMEYMNSQQINTILWSTANMAAVSTPNTFARITPKSLHTVAFSGEPLTARQLTAWQEALPKARFWSLYGQAETAGVCCYYEVDRKPRAENGIPLGRPFPNTGIVLLDDSGSEALPGMVGEICVRGSRLSPGYFRDPELTAEAFVQNPQNPDTPERLLRTGDLGRYNFRGELEFAGRKESGIRCRIDLTELQTAGRSAS